MYQKWQLRAPGTQTVAVRHRLNTPGHLQLRVSALCWATAALLQARRSNAAPEQITLSCGVKYTVPWNSIGNSIGSWWRVLQVRINPICFCTCSGAALTAAAKLANCRAPRVVFASTALSSSGGRSSAVSASCEASCAWYSLINLHCGSAHTFKAECISGNRHVHVSKHEFVFAAHVAQSGLHGNDACWVARHLPVCGGTVTAALSAVGLLWLHHQLPLGIQVHAQQSYRIGG